MISVIPALLVAEPALQIYLKGLKGLRECHMRNPAGGHVYKTPFDGQSLRRLDIPESCVATSKSLGTGIRRKQLGYLPEKTGYLMHALQRDWI